MNKLGVVVALIVTVAPALADDAMRKTALAQQLGQEIGAAFSQDSKTKAWVPASSSIEDGKAKCQKTLEALAALGVPGTTKTMLQNDTAELVKGEYTIDDLLPICERVSAFAKTKRYTRWVYDAMLEYPRVGPKTPYNESYFVNCITEYGKMMKAGIPPTYKIPDQTVADNDGKEIVWGGTVEDLRKKWCDGGLKNAKAETERRDGPYKKVLKGDKLATALAWRSVWLAGGGMTSDPAAMAKANVWFTDAFPGLICLKKGSPEVHELTRLQFDGAGTLVSSSSKKYCGDPPKSAYQ